ncbi:hypothetical protein LBMAG56_41090 [Verrucomicrobiota bacterium]|nr:hypothetical protein LBMAG56_41090 [Verrucomicrobiota bacterium]
MFQRAPRAAGLECDDSSPLSHRRLVAVKVRRVSVPARVPPLARAARRPLATGRLPPPDGDQSPRESGDKSPHSKGRGEIHGIGEIERIRGKVTDARSASLPTMGKNNGP